MLIHGLQLGLNFLIGVDIREGLVPRKAKELAELVESRLFPRTASVLVFWYSQVWKIPFPRLQDP